MSAPIVTKGYYGRIVYHTDHDCHRIKDPDNTRPASDVEQDELRECRICQGETGGGGTKQSKGHLQSLKAAAKGAD